MRLHHPRITPLSDAALTPEQREALLRAVVPGRQPLNIFRTFAHAPDALTPFLTWGSYILSKKNSLNARQREIVILRIGYLCKAGYEWTLNHVMHVADASELFRTEFHQVDGRARKVA